MDQDKSLLLAKKEVQRETEKSQFEGANKNSPI